MHEPVPVKIEGDWIPVRYVGYVAWEGVVHADEPITALALVREGNTVRWARVGRDPASALRISLKVSPRETSVSRCDVSMALSMWPEAVTTGHGRVYLAADAALSSTAPFVFSLNHAQTGQPFWFAKAWTDVDLRFGALFLPQTMTRSARNGLWHMRERQTVGSTVLDDALSKGRTGQFAAF